MNKKLTTQEYNLKILDCLKYYITKYPELRFQQILTNLNLIKDNNPLYNEESKQETMLYVVLKEQEKEDFSITPKYEEANLADIGTDYEKGKQTARKVMDYDEKWDEKIQDILNNEEYLNFKNTLIKLCDELN